MIKVSAAHDEHDCETGVNSMGTCNHEHVEESCWGFLYRHLKIGPYETPIPVRKYIYSNRPNTGWVRAGSDFLGSFVVIGGLLWFCY